MPDPDHILRDRQDRIPSINKSLKKLKHRYIYVIFRTKKELTELYLLKFALMWFLWNNNMPSGKFWLLKTSRYIESSRSHECYTWDEEDINFLVYLPGFSTVLYFPKKRHVVEISVLSHGAIINGRNNDVPGFIVFRGEEAT